MECEKWFLDENCDEKVGSKTIGEFVRRTGKIHLWSERGSNMVDTVVLHYMSAINIDPRDPYNLETIIRIFCDYKVSSHFFIDRQGICHQLVPEDKKAWHSGGSIMPLPDNRKNVNDFSIGIELLATETSGFTQEQYTALVTLCIYIEKYFGKRMTYVGHEQIAGQRAVELGLRSEIKVDPGLLFNWELFNDMLRS